MADKKLEKSGYLYIFLHIPKTGGSSFGKHIRKNIKKKRRLLLKYYRMRFNNKLTKKDALERFRRDIKNYSSEEKKKIRMIYGHGVPYGVHKYFDRPARYIVFFREPNRRTISWYNFLVGMYKRDFVKGLASKYYNCQLLIDGKIADFNDWVKVKYGEKGCGVETVSEYLQYWGYLDGTDKKDIEKMFKKFYFIGVTKTLTKDLGYLYETLNFNKHFIRQNISKKQVKKIKNETKKLLDKKNRLDKEIFEQAIKVRKKFVANKKSYYKKIKKAAIKKRLFLPFTQILFDFKGTLIDLSAYLRRKSKLYEKYFDIIRGYK